MPNTTCPTPAQDHFYSRRWGVFIHYLRSVQNPDAPDWDEAVNALDVQLLARQLAEVGAGYLILTLMQGSRYICAPSETYEKLTGFARGEATCRRDLVAELADALAQYGIDLFLYYTGDGPHLDAEAMLHLYGPGYTDIAPDKCLVTPHFVENWTAVLRELACRWGDKIKGWWMDGMYPTIGYTPELIAPYKAAVRAGNPEALFSANYHGCFKTAGTVDLPGVGETLVGDFYHEIAPPTPACDFTAGEAVSLDVYPTCGRLVAGAQAHVLGFLGIPPHPAKVYEGWAAPGCKYSPEYLARYVREVHALGGVVSLDVRMDKYGRIDPAQLAALAAINK